MSENLEKQIDEWEQNAKKLITRIASGSKETISNLRKDYDSLQKQGRDLVTKANKRADETQQNVRKQWKATSDRAGIVQKDLQKAWEDLTGKQVKEEPKE